MTDTHDERAELARELLSHLRWAEARGLRELPRVAKAAAEPARPPAKGPPSPEALRPPPAAARPAEAIPALPPLRPREPSRAPPDALRSLEALRAPPAAKGPSSPEVARPAAPAAKGPPPPAPEPAAPSARWSFAPKAAERPHPAPDAGLGSDALVRIRTQLGACTRCKLCEGRTHLVFGTGAPKARLVFVGEGPGADEDAQGIPFVGKAGQLLTKMIEAMGFARDDVYICNVVKCRPPGNRNPEPDEIAACEPFLKAQLAAIGPEAIVALGKFAAQTLLRDQTPITRLRGQWRAYEGIPLMPTFHPAYLLRSPQEKKKAWEDLQQVMARFGMTPPKRGGKGEEGS